MPRLHDRYSLLEVSEAEPFKLCTTCKKPIGFGASYLQCSVSTCNRAKLAQFFCTLACWDAHLPEAKHRDAWAEPMTAPTREAFLREQQDELQREQRASARESSMSEEAEKRRRIIGAATEDLPKDVLVVVSKLKAYIKARSGMNTSDSVTEVLSNQIRKLCDAAIEVAQADGRKTVLDRDFK
jgi:histone H3/H4